MISKQIFRTAFRAAKTSSSPSTAASSRLSSISSVLRPVQTTRYDSTPVRWLTSSFPRLEEASEAAETAQTTSAPSSTVEADLVAVYLSNLSFSVTEELLTEFLKEHVPVVKVDVVRNSDGAARGFGFAKFTTQAEAEAAVTAINGLDFLGRQIVAAISHRRPVISAASNQLFMSGFPTEGEADEAALRLALHQQIGIQPRSIRFHKFPGGFLKGTGHIEFDDVSTLERVLEKLQQLGPEQPIIVNGHVLSLVKARPLVQAAGRNRGGFAPTRGRGGFGGPAYGGAPYAGQYGGHVGSNNDGYNSSPSAAGYPGQNYGPAYSQSGYGSYERGGNNDGSSGGASF